MKKLLLTALATAAIMAAASPAQAKAPALGVCATTDISPTALSCAGVFGGNLDGGSPAKIQAAKDALALLGYTWNGVALEKLDSLTGSVFDFTTPLQGISFISVHFGAGSGKGNGTSFFKIDAGSSLDQITLNLNGLSNAVLYSTGTPTPGVPEPGTWAMMLLGFGAVGGALNRSKRKSALQVA